MAHGWNETRKGEVEYLATNYYGFETVWYRPFSLLLGVALSDLSCDFSGNFCVFPQSHHQIHGLRLPHGRLRCVDESSVQGATVNQRNPWGAGQGLPDLGIL